MATMKNNKAIRRENDSKAMHGVDLHLAQAGNMAIGGETFTPVTLKGVFQADLDALDQVDAARTALKDKVAAAVAARKRTTAVRKVLKAYLIGQNGPAAVQVLEDFGLTVPKAPGPRTVKAKAAGQAKATATRGRKKDALKAATEPAVPETTAPAPTTAVPAAPVPAVK